MIWTSLVVAASLVACGPRSGAKGPSSPVDVGAYAALRWVPADATYVVAARSTEDATVVLREMINVVGILIDADADAAASAMRRELGFDILSGGSLADIGVDRDGGAAVFSQGLSPTVAVKLSDPARVTELIDRLREGGAAVQVERRGGVEIFTYNDSEARLHWAIADGWLWVHVELVGEKEVDGAWFDALRSAGGAMAAQADWKAALSAATRRIRGATVAPDGPPVAGVIRTPALADRIVRLGAPAACLGQASRATRILLAIGVTGVDAVAAFTVELGDAAPGMAALIRPPMPGWAKARGEAPIQAEWSLDLAGVTEALRACDGGVSARAVTDDGFHTVRLFLHGIDMDNLSARGAAHLDLGHRRKISEFLDQLPARRLVERKVKIGPFDGASVQVPMLPPFTYVLTDTLFLAGVDLDLSAVVGAGSPAASTSAAHLELHPNALPAATWDGLLEQVRSYDEARKRMVRRLQRWDLGRIDLDLDGTELVLTAHGRLRK